MKNKFFKHLITSLVNIFICFLILFPFFDLLCISTTGQCWSIAKGIEIAQKETNSKFLSGTFVDSKNEFSNYYSSSSFYNISYLAKLYSDDPNANSIFYQYETKNDQSIFSVKVGDDYVQTSLFLHPYLDASYKFDFKLKFGEQISSSELNSACEYLYISESLANSLNLTVDNIKDFSLPVRMNYFSSEATKSTFKDVHIAGVVDEESIGVYKDYISSANYAFTNWSTDVQNMMNCQYLNILFADDIVMNKVYINNIIYFPLDFYINESIGSHEYSKLTEQIFFPNETFRESEKVLNFFISYLICNLILLIGGIFALHFKIWSILLEDMKKNNFIYIVISQFVITLFLLFCTPLYIDSIFLVVNELYAFLLVIFIFLAFLLNTVIKILHENGLRLFNFRKKKAK